MNRKGILIILDGYGEGKDGKFNAVKNATTPFLHFIKQKCPTTLIYTHGKYVGLEDNQMGGSEVGHQTIGAGRIVKSKTVRIDESINSNVFKDIPLIKSVMEKLKKSGTLHLVGLLSDKGIHSNISHLFAILNVCKKYGIKNVLVHVITDGRDTPIDAGVHYVEMLQNYMEKLEIGEIASIGGRFFAMDREKNTERTQEGFNAMFFDKETIDDPILYLKEQYKKGIYDEFVRPKHIKTTQTNVVDDNDVIFFYNTREDRMRQLVQMSEEQLNDDIELVSMTKYGDFVRTKNVFEDLPIQNTLSEYLSSLNLKQLKISETTKYAHVTYFLNGQVEKSFEGEERNHIPTFKTSDYASYPQMRAVEISKKAIENIKTNKYDLIIINFSNPDMIGHTANYEATLKALKVVDSCVKNIVNTAFKKDYFCIITADHGNAEQLRDESGRPQTAHTLNPVMFSILDKDNINIFMKNGGSLRDVAPTILQLMELPPNPCFEGKPLYFK